MVLRLRADLPEMKQAPELPHLAAKHMFDAAQQHHIPYDFRLDHEDSSAMFCSEVASVAYASQHIQNLAEPRQPFREAASGNGFMILELTISILKCRRTWNVIPIYRSGRMAGYGNPVSGPYR